MLARELEPMREPPPEQGQEPAWFPVTSSEPASPSGVGRARATPKRAPVLVLAPLLAAAQAQTHVAEGPASRKTAERC